MNGLFYFQVFSSLLCVVAICLNVKQAARWHALRKRFVPVCRVVRADGDQVLFGMTRALPPPGTVLYVFEDAAKPPPGGVLHV